MDKPTSLSFDVILKQAFDRLKERFFGYFALTLMQIAFGIVVVLLILVASLVIGVLTATTKSPVVAGVLAMALSVVVFGLALYVGSLFQLMMFQNFASDKKQTINEMFADLKPVVWKYVGLMFLQGLFFLGLMPFFLGSLFILAMVWGVWASMTTFVFLKMRRGGLSALWTSKKMVSGQFWTLFALIFLLFCLNIGISFAMGYYGREMGGLQVVTFLFSYFMGAYWIAVMAEIFHMLPSVDEVKGSMGWIITSVIGGVLSILMIVSFGYLMVTTVVPALEKVFKDPKMQRQFMQELQKQSPSKDNYMLPDDSI